MHRTKKGWKMKSLKLLALSLVCFVQAWGSIVPPTSLPMGSEKAVTDYCLSTGENVFLYIMQYDDSTGEWPAYVNKAISQIKFKTLDELNLKIQAVLKQKINQLITHNYGQDNSKKFTWVADLESTSDVEIYFWGSGSFFLDKDESGFKCPNLDNVSLSLPKTIPYRLRAEWVRSEILDETGLSTRIDDSRENGELTVRLDDGTFRVEIPREDAIAAGKSRTIKVLASINGKTVYYVNGVIAEQDLPTLKINLYPSTTLGIKVIVTVSGGSGDYMVQSSTDLSAWTDTGSTYTGPTLKNFSFETTNGVFYRLRSINAP